MIYTERMYCYFPNMWHENATIELPKFKDDFDKSIKKIGVATLDNIKLFNTLYFKRFFDFQKDPDTICYYFIVTYDENNEAVDMMVYKSNGALIPLNEFQKIVNNRTIWTRKSSNK